MSQYSPGFGQYPSPQPYVEQRTSVMAVLSLVFALICCPPGPAVLGLLFGIFALIAIGRSNDRLVGRGLAIAGIIISLIVCALWLGFLVAAGRVLEVYRTDIAAPLAQKIEAMDSGNYAEFRTLLTPEANARISDADIDAFRAGYQSELGQVVGTPGTLMEIIGAAAEAQQAWEPAQGRNDVFPLIMRFQNGPGIVLLQVDPAASQSGSNPGQMQFANVIISAPSRNKWTLWDPATLPPAQPPPAPLPPAPDSGTPPAPSGP